MTISDTYFQAFYDELSEGQKQHMTNKIFKESGLYPQKLRHSAAYPAGTKFTNRQTGSTYVLSSVYVGNVGYWAAINPATGMAYATAKILDRVTDDNLSEILVHPKNFKVEK